MFYKYDSEALKRVCQSLLKRYNQVLRKMEGDEVEVEHTGTRKRQREGALARSVELDREASKAAWDWWVSGIE